MSCKHVVTKGFSLAAMVLSAVFGVGCPLEPCTTDPVDGVYVNIQVDAEQDDTIGLKRMLDALDDRDIPATVYVTAEYANQHAMRVQNVYRQGFEIALHGYHTGEQLATMTYAEQKDLLSRAKTALEGCQPCGTYIPVTGFRPQYFSQNDDTFTVLDELGLTYNSGFKAGQLYTEGHENDIAPYPIAGHNAHALPISTVAFSDGRMYLCDIGSAQGAGVTGPEWDQMLQDALADALTNHQPLVVLFHGWYTGDKDQYDYWQPFINFLDAARCNVTFVTSQELVDLFAEDKAN